MVSIAIDVDEYLLLDILSRKLTYNHDDYDLYMRAFEKEVQNLKQFENTNLDKWLKRYLDKHIITDSSNTSFMLNEYSFSGEPYKIKASLHGRDLIGPIKI